MSSGKSCASAASPVAAAPPTRRVPASVARVPVPWRRRAAGALLTSYGEFRQLLEATLAHGGAHRLRGTAQGVGGWATYGSVSTTR
jgi:hypothetical protein